MKISVETIVISALLIAITILFAITPLGYILIGPVQITFMCLPVIVGTLTKGWKIGLLLGLIFALSSLYKAVSGQAGPLLTPLFVQHPFIMSIPIFVPRLLVPLTTYNVYRLIAKSNPKREAFAVGAAALLGSLTNTVLFLGILSLTFPTAMAIGTAAVVAATNGIPEAIAAMIICVPIVLAINKTLKRRIPGS